MILSFILKIQGSYLTWCFGKGKPFIRKTPLIECIKIKKSYNLWLCNICNCGFKVILKCSPVNTTVKDIDEWSFWVNTAFCSNRHSQRIVANISESKAVLSKKEKCSVIILIWELPKQKQGFVYIFYWFQFSIFCTFKFFKKKRAPPLHLCWKLLLHKFCLKLLKNKCEESKCKFYKFWSSSLQFETIWSNLIQFKLDGYIASWKSKSRSCAYSCTNTIRHASR